MDLRTLASEIDRRLRAAGKRERREIAAGYFPTSMEVLGVAVPDLRRCAREIGRRLRDAPPQQVLELARILIDADTFEGRQAAYEILAGHASAMGRLTTRTVEPLGRGIDNWASVDAFACLIAGPSWRDRRVTEPSIRRWARSRDRWWRRAAIVSTVPLNQKSKGGSGDSRRTLDVGEIVAGDRDEMVAKGLSWALRELAKVDRRAVVGFLRRHEDCLHARVLREVRNKLRTGLKTPRGKR